MTSRLAAATGRSPGLSLPLGRTHDLSRRSRTMATRGLRPSRNKIPPAARIGAGVFAESVMSKDMQDERVEGKQKYIRARILDALARHAALASAGIELDDLVPL